MSIVLDGLYTLLWLPDSSDFPRVTLRLAESMTSPFTNVSKNSQAGTYVVDDKNLVRLNTISKACLLPRFLNLIQKPEKQNHTVQQTCQATFPIPIPPGVSKMASTDQLHVSNLFSMKDAVCLVSGGGTGIGLMATQALAANGTSSPSSSSNFTY